MNIERIFNNEDNLTLDEIISSITKDISNSIIKDFFDSLKIEDNNLTIKGEN